MGQGIAGLSGCDWYQCMNLTKFRDTMVKGGWVSQMFEGELLKKCLHNWREACVIFWAQFVHCLGNHIRNIIENQEYLDSGIKPTKFGYRCSQTGTKVEETIVVI